MTKKQLAMDLEDEGDNRPPRYEEDGKIIYRASSLMMCDRVFIALLENYTPAAHPDWFQKVLNEGTRMEPKIISMYEETFDTSVTGSQLPLEMEIVDGVWIRGHIDGMEQGPNGDRLFEAKKIRESMWSRFKQAGVEYIAHYPWQVSFYMHAMEVGEAVMVGGLYSPSKDQIEDLYVHTLANPPIPMKAIVKRIAYLESLVNGGKRVDDVKCNVRQFPCPFYYLHDTDDEEAPPKRVIPDDMAALVTERDQIKAQVKAMNDEAKPMEERVREINKELEAWMRKASVDDDQFIRVELGDDEYEMKYHKVYRKQYTVNETDYTLVTVRQAKTNKAATKKGK